MRGAYLLISLREAASVLAISARIRARATRALLHRLGHQAVRHAAQLQVELEAR